MTWKVSSTRLTVPDATSAADNAIDTVKAETTKDASMTAQRMAEGANAVYSDVASTILAQVGACLTDTTALKSQLRDLENQVHDLKTRIARSYPL